MISFDVNSLFTRTPLDQTIKIILSQAYQEKKIKTSIPKKILREIFRSTHSEVFLGKRILKICNRFTGEHPYRSRSMISIKLQSNFIEITPWHGCSPVRCSPLAWLFSFGMSVLLWTAAFDFCTYVQKKLTLSRFTSKTMELQWLSIRIITRKHFYDVIRKKVIPT